MKHKLKDRLRRFCGLTCRFCSLHNWLHCFQKCSKIVQIEGKRIVRRDDKQRATPGKRSSFENPAVKIVRSVKFYGMYETLGTADCFGEVVFEKKSEEQREGAAFFTTSWYFMPSAKTVTCRFIVTI